MNFVIRMRAAERRKIHSLGRQPAGGSDVWPRPGIAGLRPLAGDGVSRRPKAVSNPRTKVKRKNKPRSGDRNLELKAVAHIAVISVRLASLAQERSVAPSGGFLSNFRPYPGAHAPGYESAAPPALKLGRHSGGCSLRYLLGCQPRPGRDSLLHLASCILHPPPLISFHRDVLQR